MRFPNANRGALIPLLILIVPNNQTFDRKLKNNKDFSPLGPDVHPKRANHHVEHPPKWLSLQSTKNQQTISVQELQHRILQIFFSQIELFF